MKKILAVALVATLAACGGAEQQATEAREPWGEYVTRVVDEYYAHNPEVAVYQGLHQYDGQASDFSQASIDEYLSWLDETINATAAYDDLEGIEAFERDYLLQGLRADVFYARDSGFVYSNPITYAFSMSFEVYVDREYAPIEERIRAYTAYVSEVPRMLRQMRENLRTPAFSPRSRTNSSSVSSWRRTARRPKRRSRRRTGSRRSAGPLPTTTHSARSCSWRCSARPRASTLRWTN